MNDQPRRPSARQQVAERQGSDDEIRDKLAAVFTQRVAKSYGWFAKVVPAHIDSERYLELAWQHIKTGGNPKLMVACVQNPDSLMVALIDCARYGLVVGDTYHLVPFYDNKVGRYVVTGMRDYKGEIELIYRSGMVDAVFAYAVRGDPKAKSPDVFSWRPGMVFPEHVIADDGLADPEDRGHLRGAYAYARLSTGGYSPVIVMSKSQVLRTKPTNAPAEFWGPDWPAEGKNTEAMWVKGPVHRLYSRVPHSADFIAEMQRASASAAEASQALALPPPGAAAIEPPDTQDAILGEVVPPDGNGRASVRSRTEPTKPVAQLKRDLAALFAEVGFGKPDDELQRHAVAWLLWDKDGDPPAVKPLGSLSANFLGAAIAKVTQIRDEAKSAGRDPVADFGKLADALAQRLAAHAS